MSDHSINDPNLQDLESRLANMILRVSPRDAQNLLYQCAFEAGQKKTGKAIRRWQAAVATLFVVSMGLSVALVNQKVTRTDMVQSPPTIGSQSTSTVASSNGAKPAAAQDIPQISRKEISVDLDAWQLRSTNGETTASDMALVVHSDPTLQPYTVGALTRTVFVP